MLLQEHLLITTDDIFADSWTTIGRHLPADWIEQAIFATDTATRRTRRLTLPQVVWLILCIALMRNRSIADVAASLDLALPGKHHSVASSA